MHDRTRRWICRTLFILGCLLPTAGVLAWAASYHLPGSRARLEAELGARLGAQVSIGKVTYPRPGVMIFEQVSLADAETGSQLVRIATLEATWSGEQLALVAPEATVEQAGLARLWQVMLRQLRSAPAPRVSLAAGDVRCRRDGPRGTETVANYALQASIEPSTAGAQASLAWREPADAEARQARLELTRDRQSSPPTTSWELNSGETPLRCALVAAIVPEVERLGPACEFRGRVAAQEADRHWTCEISGNLTDIDMQRVLDGVFPYYLDGTARVAIEQANLRDGRLTSASATLTAGPGRFARQLVWAAGETLGLEPAVSHETLLETEPYRELAIALGINARGLLLRGVAQESSGQPGVVLTAPWGIVLKTRPPDHPLLPLAALAHLFAPEATSTVPATQPVQRLITLLPLPAN